MSDRVFISGCSAPFALPQRKNTKGSCDRLLVCDTCLRDIPVLWLYSFVESFALDILPVIDNCERALALKPEDSNDENYRKAFEMVFRQLSAALKKEGVEEIEALDQEYDPNWMQAMMMEHVEGVEPGRVTAVLQKGYKLKDRLLRAAMVKVSE